MSECLCIAGHKRTCQNYRVRSHRERPFLSIALLSLLFVAILLLIIVAPPEMWR